MARSSFLVSKIGLQFGRYLTCGTCGNKYTAWIVRRRNTPPHAVELECMNCSNTLSLRDVEVTPFYSKD